MNDEIIPASVARGDRITCELQYNLCLLQFLLRGFTSPMTYYLLLLNVEIFFCPVS